jgi:bisphosphoglycerate-dependent phosphoglycerate mutase
MLLFTSLVNEDVFAETQVFGHRAAKNLAEEGFTFDIMYTSLLQRAIKTGLTILEVCLHLPMMFCVQLFVNAAAQGSLRSAAWTVVCCFGTVE